MPSIWRKRRPRSNRCVTKRENSSICSRAGRLAGRSHRAGNPATQLLGPTGGPRTGPHCPSHGNDWTKRRSTLSPRTATWPSSTVRALTHFSATPNIRGENSPCGALVAIGTDGRGSNPDLSVWNELLFLRSAYPDVDPALLLQMGTQNGARALGLESRLGTLEAGKTAGCRDSTGRLRHGRSLRRLVSSALAGRPSDQRLTIRTGRAERDRGANAGAIEFADRSATLISRSNEFREQPRVSSTNRSGDSAVDRIWQGA